MTPHKATLFGHGGEVSYVAGMRFADFIVMSADTQESYNDEVCYEEKLEIEKTPTVDLVIGGAGRSELAEAFARHLVDKVTAAKPVTRDQLYKVLSRVIQSFYANDVRLFPGKRKATAFLIASRLASGEIHLWKSVGMRIKELTKHGVVGYARPLVSNLLRRLYRSDLSPSQAVLLALHIIASAKIGNRVIGGDPQVVFVNKTGIYPEPAEHVADMNTRFRKLLPLVDELVLAMPDLSITESAFTAMVNEFREKVLQHRHDYKNELAEEVAKGKITWPYDKLPLGSTVFQSFDDAGKRTLMIYSDPNDPGENETWALRVDKDGLHFRPTVTAYISDKVFEHLIQCQSANLKECIEHIGRDC
jgi:20S proteasome alpha/beta subunit